MDCLFCKIINGEVPSYTIYEDEFVKCFLDIDPISEGHTLIVPKKHFTDIHDIDMEYLTKILETAKKISSLLEEKLNPSGIRLLQNNGSIQDIKHFHIHLTPRYKEDCLLHKFNKDILKELDEVFKILTEQ